MTDRKKLLVVYPAEFNSYEKLVRKLEFYTSKLSGVELVQLTDHNGLLERYTSEKALALQAAPAHAEGSSRADFAVIFEDARYPLEGISSFLPDDSRVRKIPLSITRVVNIDRDSEAARLPDYEYIGRGSYWGNPYSMYEAGESREEVIRKYQYDFDFDKFPNKDKQRVVELRGKTLGCHCKPAQCHGEILADYLNSLDDEL